MTSKFLKTGLGILALSTALAGCGGSGSLLGSTPVNNGPNSCDLSNINSTCSDFSATQGQTSCPGAFSKNPCPTANRVGSCASQYATVRYYSSGTKPFTTSQARDTCTAPGVFTPN